MNTYKEGQPVKVAVTITDPSTGNPVDAAALTLTWGVLPNVPNQPRVITSKSLTDGVLRDGTGKYHYVIDTTGVIPGSLSFVVVAYEWVAVGGVAGAEDKRFVVEALPL